MLQIFETYVVVAQKVINKFFMLEKHKNQEKTKVGYLMLAVKREQHHIRGYFSHLYVKSKVMQNQGKYLAHICSAVP